MFDGRHTVLTQVVAKVNRFLKKDLDSSEHTHNTENSWSVKKYWGD